MAGWLMMNAAIVGGYLTARLRTHPAYQARKWGESFRELLASGALLTAIEGVCIIGVMLATMSRSAVAGSAAALAYGWHAGRPRLRVERMRVPTIAALIVVGILGGLLFIDVQGWMGRLGDSFGQSETGGFGRISIWRETLPIVRDFWLAGTGAGTFSDAMMRYQESHVWINSMQRWAHFNNAHSHYIQVIAEGGVLLAIPVATALTMFWKLGRRSVRADKGEMFWVRIGALAGLVGLAVQSVWEVSLVMPANAVMAGVLGGLVLYRRDPNSRTDKDMAKAA
jgi:O-antigen ligase